MRPPEAVLCPAGEWTRLYAGPCLGALNLWAQFPGQRTRYRAFTANLPFFMQGAAVIGAKTQVLFGLPTFYVDFQVMPENDCLLVATSDVLR